MESVSSDIKAPALEDADDDPGSPGANGPAPKIYPHSALMDRIDPDAVKVLRRLTGAGFEAYLVGGGVRDLLLGRTPKDFDVATSARPNEVRGLFRNCRVIGRRFRLAHILFGGGKIVEVATFRRDPTEALDLAENEFGEEMQALAEESGEGDGNVVTRRKDRTDDVDLLIRHDNVFGEPHEDAIRRDFTCNGLFYDIEREEVIDYVGGWPDLERRVLRTIGDPVVRFREDPIRILRAIKFSARCDFGLEPDVYDAMVCSREELRKSAPPRVMEEILRLLRGGAAHRSFWLAWDTGLLSVMLPELSAYLDDEGEDSAAFWTRLDLIDLHTKEHGAPVDSLLMLALLYGVISEGCDGARDPSIAFENVMAPLARRLSIPRRMRDRMRLVYTSQKRLVSGRYSNLLRRDFFAEAVQFFMLQCEAHGEEIPRWAEQISASPQPASRGPARDSGVRDGGARDGGARDAGGPSRGGSTDSGGDSGGPERRPRRRRRR